MRFIATCKLGLESTVAFQLRKMNIEPIQTLDARVVFEGDYATMAKALMWLRTAERLLLEVGSFRATSFDDLFEGTKALEWKRYLKPTTRIHVNGKSAKSTLFSVSDCQSIVKKAIVENLRSAYRVSAIPETAEEVIVEIGMLRDVATLALDCCGAGLSRRGYRTYNVAAPLSETLGAAMISLAGYYPDKPLIDPMCGSGTLPIEAAMIGNNIAPSLHRTFASEQWRFIDPKVFSSARQEAQDIQRHDKLLIMGSDIDSRCIDLCKKHAKKAGVQCEWIVRPLKELRTEWKNGVLVCNPPYGERLMSHKEVEQLYRDMRYVFDGFSDWQISVITAMKNFETLYGKRADKRRKLSNGGMTCTIYRYFGIKEPKE